MKHDLRSFLVTVTGEHMPFWQFFVVVVKTLWYYWRYFSTTDMLHGIENFIVEINRCHFRLGSYKPVYSIYLEDGHASNH